MELVPRNGSAIRPEEPTGLLTQTNLLCELARTALEPKGLGAMRAMPRGVGRLACGQIGRLADNHSRIRAWVGMGATANLGWQPKPRQLDEGSPLHYRRGQLEQEAAGGPLTQIDAQAPSHHSMDR